MSKSQIADDVRSIVVERVEQQMRTVHSRDVQRLIESGMTWDEIRGRLVSKAMGV